MKFNVILAVLLHLSVSFAVSPPSEDVCYTPSQLKPFCPPCPPICGGINNCPCKFPDEKSTIIQPKELDSRPRPPYCPKCPNFQCKIRVCINAPLPCTAEAIQILINK